MYISWLIGDVSSKDRSSATTVYPVVFPMQKDEINALLDWIRSHRCFYSEENSAREILEGYTNDEIMDNGLLGMLLEQYGNDGNSEEGNISVIMQPSVHGIKYTFKCKCGDTFTYKDK